MADQPDTISSDASKGEIDLITKWIKRFQSSENYYKPFFDRGRENYKLYKSFKTNSDKVYKHDIFVPYSFAYLEDMASYFMLSVLASPVTYSYSPRYLSISEELCSEIEQLVHWALTDENTEFALEVEETIKHMGIYNAGYLINYPVTFKDGSFDHVHLDAPHPLDVFPEPGSKRLTRASWVIKRSWEKFERLKELEKAGEYKHVDECRGGLQDQDQVTKALQDVGIDVSKQVWKEDEQEVEVIDAMTGGDVITIGGRKAVLRDTTKDPIRPFLYDFPILDCRMTGAPGEYFGIGVIEAFKPLQRELNLLRSQRRDNISLILDKLFIYDILAGEVDLATLFSAPGNVIVTTNKDALSELPIEDVTASSFKEEQSIIYDIQNVTSMWDYARGATPKRRETASGIIRLQQAAQGRNEWLLRKLDYYIFQPFGRRMLVYLRENISRSDYAAVIGNKNHADEFFALDPEQLKRMIQVQPMTESIVSVKELNVNQFMQAFDRLIQIQGVNVPALLKALLLKLGQKNIKEILPMLSEQGQETVNSGMQQMMQQRQGLPMPAFGRPPQEAQQGAALPPSPVSPMGEANPNPEGGY